MVIRGWKDIRKKILERDSWNCRVCRTDDNLHVHHIDYSRDNNEMENLVTLCRDCHGGIHRENYMPCDHEDWPAPWDKTKPIDEYDQTQAW